jgi:hypothetical protein
MSYSLPDYLQEINRFLIPGGNDRAGIHKSPESNLFVTRDA